MTLHASSRLRDAVFHVLRFGFRLTPMRQATRDRLRQRFLDRHAALVPDGPRGQVAASTSRARRHAAHVRSGSPAIGHTHERQETLPDPLPATLIAFYLPQFHPIAENDAWWGKGFTEWRNVSRALPQFEGHHQPRLPGDLGFYDLRVGDVMQQQMQLARTYGIGAFCFYYYWFAGTRLLESPLQQWLADPSLDLPICLCWANENWSRRWDGRADDILIAQEHSAADDHAFIAHVSRYLRDPRYLRVDGKPLLLVYRSGLLPDAAATARRWREACRESGVGEIYLACVQGFEQADPRRIGFDAAVEFPPNLCTPGNITARQHLLNPEYHGHVLDWRDMAQEIAARPMPDYTLFPGVNPAWDNEPRRSGRGRVYAHAAPRGYRDWLQRTIESRASQLPSNRRLVFINAWNEWAEGAVLEPDARLGHAWLEATRQALRRAAGASAATVSAKQPCAVIHAWYPEVLAELLQALQRSGLVWRLIVTTTPDQAAAVRRILDVHTLPYDIEIAANRGRDILPFLRVANRLVDEGAECVLKLHTKRSTHRGDGDRWRREMIDRLLAPQRAERIVAAFRDEPDLGLVAPEGHVQPLRDFWGANRDHVAYLTRCMGIPAADDVRDTFIAGSMFWLRPHALRPLLDAHLAEDEFDIESGQVDGTLAHAIERVFTLSARAAGCRVTTAAALCQEPEPDTSSYPYARRS